MIKHTICDYILQTDCMVKYKGVYGDKRGVKHSTDHLIGTFVIFVVLFPSQPFKAVAVALLDGIIHYHIDWIKIKYFGQYKNHQKEYWCAFGTDQLYHYFTYVAITMLFLL